MNDRGWVILADSYARRLPPNRWTLVRSASRGRVDPALVGAVVAVESGNRGPATRLLENAFARVLVSVGAEQRFARLSLGIAQVQPRRLGLPCSCASLRLLNDETFAVDACVSVVLDSCETSVLDPRGVGTWQSSAWHAFGWAYHGSRLYGEVLSATYARLCARFADSCGA
jgi:hypothetical protein